VSTSFSLARTCVSVEHGLMIQIVPLVFELFTVAIVDLSFSFNFQCCPLVCKRGGI
jgi:hypothetical protein